MELPRLSNLAPGGFARPQSGARQRPGARGGAHCLSNTQHSNGKSPGVLRRRGLNNRDGRGRLVRSLLTKHLASKGVPDAGVMTVLNRFDAQIDELFRASVRTVSL